MSYAWATMPSMVLIEMGLPVIKSHQAFGGCVCTSSEKREYMAAA